MSWDTDTTPHQMPPCACHCDGDLLGWRCQSCGEWIPEHGPLDRTACPIDWRYTDPRGRTA